MLQEPREGGGHALTDSRVPLTSKTHGPWDNSKPSNSKSSNSEPTDSPQPKLGGFGSSFGGCSRSRSIKSGSCHTTWDTGSTKISKLSKGPDPCSKLGSFSCGQGSGYCTCPKSRNTNTNSKSRNSNTGSKSGNTGRKPSGSPELGFGGRLSRGFGCSWGPCSYDTTGANANTGTHADSGNQTDTGTHADTRDYPERGCFSGCFGGCRCLDPCPWYPFSAWHTWYFSGTGHQPSQGSCSCSTDLGCLGGRCLGCRGNASPRNTSNSDTEARKAPSTNAVSGNTSNSHSASGPEFGRFGCCFSSCSW